MHRRSTLSERSCASSRLHQCCGALRGRSALRLHGHCAWAGRIRHGTFQAEQGVDHTVGTVLPGRNKHSAAPGRILARERLHIRTRRCTESRVLGGYFTVSEHFYERSRHSARERDILTHQILGEPHPAMRINVEANSDAMQGFARQMNEMRSRRSLIHHAFLYSIDIGPGRVGRPCQPDVFTPIGKACETLIRDTDGRVYTIWTGVAEATMKHIPAVQASAACQGRIPYKRVETTYRPVVVHQAK